MSRHRLAAVRYDPRSGVSEWRADCACGARVWGWTARAAEGAHRLHAGEAAVAEMADVLAHVGLAA